MIADIFDTLLMNTHFIVVKQENWGFKIAHFLKRTFHTVTNHERLKYPISVTSINRYSVKKSAFKMPIDYAG